MSQPVLAQITTATQGFWERKLLKTIQTMNHKFLLPAATLAKNLPCTMPSKECSFCKTRSIAGATKMARGIAAVQCIAQMPPCTTGTFLCTANFGTKKQTLELLSSTAPNKAGGLPLQRRKKQTSLSQTWTQPKRKQLGSDGSGLLETGRTKMRSISCMLTGLAATTVCSKARNTTLKHASTLVHPAPSQPRKRTEMAI